MKKDNRPFSLEKYENDLLMLGSEDICQVAEIGKSIFNRKIYALSIGKGEKVTVLVGGATGRWQEGELLLTFAKEFCRMHREKRRVYNVNPSYILSYRRFLILPILNPDGAVYRNEGVAEDNILRERLLLMNEGNEDFFEWQANGRGVSLERNVPLFFAERKRYEEANEIYSGSSFCFSGQTPMSEPELYALADMLSKEKEISLLLDMHGGAAGVRGAIGNNKKGKRVTGSIARISGLKSIKEGNYDTVGIADWACNTYGCPALSLSFDQPDYERARELLYSLPLMI